MKKVIHRRLYDTETATELATYNNGKCYSDFGYIIESLYRKKNGEFFLAGESGAFMRYAHVCSDRSVCGGSGIVPLSVEEAKDWVENFANRKYEDIFGKVEE